MSSTGQDSERFPLPNSILRVEGDPTPWGLADLELIVAPQLSANAPVALSVITPLTGTLLLAPRHAGSFMLSPLPPGGGWIPCVKLPSPYLYLPSTAGVAAHSPGYELTGPDTDLEALRHAILTAMRDGTHHTVHVSGGVVVINGAQVPFVVLAEAEPR